MINQELPFRITAEDKKRYEKLIAKTDLAMKSVLLEKIPLKIARLMEQSDLSQFVIEMVEDISKLYAILKNIPTLGVRTQRRIIFALQYFYDTDDEIPDDVPSIGYLDDALLVHWIAEGILKEFSHVVKA